MVTRVVRQFGTIRIETVNWPVIVMNAGAYRATDVQLESALEYLAQLFTESRAAGERFAQVTDLSGVVNIPSATQRRQAAQWVKRTADDMAACSVGGVAVTPSAIIRGIVTAIWWIQTPPTPVAMVATRDEGMLKVFEFLEEARVHLSPEVARRRDEIARAAEAHKKTSAWPWRR